MNKKIIIDYGKISTPYCGLAEVALNYSSALVRLSPKNLEFIFVVPSVLRKEFDRRVGAENVVTPSYKGFKRIIYYLTGNAKILCDIPSHDLYHYLHFYSPWGPGLKQRQRGLLTIHDLHALDRSRAAKRLVRRLEEVDHLAFISNFALEEYKRQLDKGIHSIKVIANGVKVPPIVNKNASQKLKDTYGDYIFTLGGLKRKNIHSLLGMLKKVKSHNTSEELKLLIAGSVKEKHKMELLNEIDLLDITSRVVFLGSITEIEKYEYMQACRAFAFPSLQEGFGLPIIEALHFGKPVFCSDKTSLPEVGGDQVYYWNNFDSDYMAKVLLDGLDDNDKHLQDNTSARKEYALTFDWDENVKQYIELYNDILA